jgi:hypothetical protein
MKLTSMPLYTFMMTSHTSATLPLPSSSYSNLSVYKTTVLFSVTKIPILQCDAGREKGVFYI